jgi:hypothetical protein
MIEGSDLWIETWCPWMTKGQIAFYKDHSHGWIYDPNLNPWLQLSYEHRVILTRVLAWCGYLARSSSSRAAKRENQSFALSASAFHIALLFLVQICVWSRKSAASPYNHSSILLRFQFIFSPLNFVFCGLSFSRFWLPSCYSVLFFISFFVSPPGRRARILLRCASYAAAKSHGRWDIVTVLDGR